MQFYPKRTVQQQANRLPQELRQAYLNSQIDRITISDNENEVELTGYAEYSYLEEKSYKTQPIRTNDGQIQDIDEYETFLTPRLIIKYNMMNIDDYRATMKLLKSKKNGFIVRCYDPVEDKIVSNEMYVAPTSMPIIYQQYLIALGIQEFSIELIGTNRTTDFSIKYDAVNLFEQFSAPVGSTWRDFIEEITFLEINGDFINYLGQNLVVLFDDEDATVAPGDTIVDGKEYFLKNI